MVGEDSGVLGQWNEREGMVQIARNRSHDLLPLGEAFRYADFIALLIFIAVQKPIKLLCGCLPAR